MKSLLDRMRERAKNPTPTEVLSPQPILSSAVENMFTPVPEGKDFAPGFRRPVVDSPDLRRILALPRRPPYQFPDEAECVRVTNELRRPGGTRVLRPLQVLGLREAKEAQGAVVNAGVGSGKTDLCACLPEYMDSVKSVLMLPPALKDKFLNIEYPYLSTQYRLPNLCRCCAKSKSKVVYTDTRGTLHVVSYSQLSTANSADILDRIAPDLIVCDEAHSVSDTNSSRTKRLRRYLTRNPGCRFVVLSGTLTKKSIKDYAHLARHALKDRSPLPHHYPTLEEWAQALDPSDFPAPSGALSRLMGSTDRDVHDGYRRRLVETPGWVATKSSRPDSGLVIHERKLDVPESVLKVIQTMRDTWETPHGEVIQDAMTFSRYARQLGQGLYLRWTWPKNEPLEVRKAWLEARRNWFSEVRDTLKHSSKEGFDSAWFLTKAAAEGRWDAEFYEDWVRLRDTAEPSECNPVWIDEFLVRDAAEWGKKHTGIIWYKHPAVGEKIAQYGGFEMFGPGTGEMLQRHAGSKTVVVSMDANGTGWNLQQFRNQLVTCPSSSGKTWEQLLGRTHRSGQEADEVECHVYLHTPEMRAAMTSARKKAEFVEKTEGLEQKLLYCTYSFDVDFQGRV